MKRLRNTSGIADGTVRQIVDWIADELGIVSFDVECRKSQSGAIVGNAYTQGSSYHSTSRPFVVLRIGTETIDHWQYTANGQTYIALKRTCLRNAPVPAVKISKQRFPTTIAPYQYAHHKGKRYVLCNRIEALVYLAAHELRHLWQAARKTDKRKSKNLPMAFGSHGKFSEIDTETFAIHCLRQYRNKQYGSTIAIKSHCGV